MTDQAKFIAGGERLPDLGSSASDHSLGRADALFKRVAWRIMPFLFVCYVLNYIDRVNISFAHLQFRADLGMSNAAYGFGVGIFFVGYILFEVPSNLLLRKIGARRTISRIMVLWGAISLSMMFVQSETHFYLARLALGIAEAGFFPGIIYYISSWFPDRHRARIISFFVLGIAVSGIVGGPVSGWILGHFDGFHAMRGWQWLFLLEGLPPILMGIWAFWFLPDNPREAKWLSSNDRELLIRELAAPTAHAAKSDHSFKVALKNPRVYICAFGWFSLTWGGSILNFWAPAIIRDAGITDFLHVGLLSAIPYAGGALFMILASRHSDLRKERVLHFSGLEILCAVGAIGLAMTHSNVTLAIICLTILAAGYLACMAIFWTIPTRFLAGTASAGTIALISSIGQIGSLTAGSAVGWLTTVTQNMSAGIFLAAGVLVLGSIAIGWLLPRLDRSVPPPAKV